MKPSVLLTDSTKWCKFVAALTSENCEVSPFSPRAVRWDLNSAISRYTGLPTRQSELRIRATEAWLIWDQDNSKSEYPCQRTLHDFNDTTTWPWVRLALEQANL